MLATRAVLESHCRELKLPRVFREVDSLKRQANADGWEYEDFLVHILELELIGQRDATAQRRIREAKFPEVKTLDQVDWTSLGGVSRAKIAELATCEFIDRHEDIVLAGPFGTGKTMSATAIGVEAARRRRRVAFVRFADLVRDLLEARDDRQLGRFQKRYQRVDLLICDELGFVPFDKAGGELLFNLLADRYESRSTIITTKERGRDEGRTERKGWRSVQMSTTGGTPCPVFCTPVRAASRSALISRRPNWAGGDSRAPAAAGLEPPRSLRIWTAHLCDQVGARRRPDSASG